MGGRERTTSLKVPPCVSGRPRGAVPRLTLAAGDCVDSSVGVIGSDKVRVSWVTESQSLVNDAGMYTFVRHWSDTFQVAIPVLGGQERTWGSRRVDAGTLFDPVPGSSTKYYVE